MEKRSVSAKEICRYLLIILIVATLVFIFTNSLKSKEESIEDSAAVGGILSTIFPPDTDFGAFIAQYLRKIAHFTEYGLLGVEVALYVCIFTKRRVRCGLIFSATPLFVGFIDESLQYISDRGPAISDVWIDIGGFTLFSLLAYASFMLVRLAWGRISALRAKGSEEVENG